MEKITLKVTDNGSVIPIKEIKFLGIAVHSFDENTFIRMNALYQPAIGSECSFSVSEVTTHANRNGLYTISFWGIDESIPNPIAEIDVTVSTMMLIMDTCKSNKVPHVITV